jgi:hypothetical protein
MIHGQTQIKFISEVLYGYQILIQLTLDNRIQMGGIDKFYFMKKKYGYVN